MTRRYPVGIQTFSEIREKGYVYVDKTDLVWKMANRLKYVFLSRPRRFGKSLLASTLKSYFEGRRDLFEGLAMEKLETAWTRHPVLHFDMSGGKHMDAESLNQYLDFLLKKEEKNYGIIPDCRDANTRMAALLEKAQETTGQQVVVIIDEYDAPLLDTMADEEQLTRLRNIMRNFYSPLKVADPVIRFVFLTGITKFSQLSIFSELNNIANVSMDDEFAAICGITREELLTDFDQDIERLAQKEETTKEEMIAELGRKYDGYHFSAECPDIYNPFSLLNCFSRSRLDNYWFGSGTPTFLVEQLNRFGMLPAELGGEIKASVDSFDAPTENQASVLPLLYQSGYITIKGYNRYSGIYTLGIPNAEVRCGLMNALAPNYLKVLETTTPVGIMTGLLLDDNVAGAFDFLRQFFKTVPYCNDIDHEGHWQQMLYVIFSLFGAKGDVEVHTSTGRVDIELRMFGKIYLIEVKLDGSAEEAIRQIEDKEYAGRFALDGLPIVKVGVNFSTRERTITDYIIR